jgi:cytochrome c oxidase subunit 2
MAFEVVAQPPARFAEWLANQRSSPPPPADSVAQRGEQAFLNGSCPLCHAVAGTPAGGNIGPDLSHFASRGTIAAGTRPNTLGNLSGWIVDPQSMKPGTQMPPNALTPADLHALTTYLESLR